MADLPEGINGPVIGKVGTVVGYILRGKAVVRGLPKKRKKKRTLEEKVNHSGFAKLQKWMSPIGDFVKYGFKDYGTFTAGYKAAISYALLNKAIQGKYPNQFIDPALIRVTGGDLLVPSFASAELDEGTEGRNIRFTWDKGNINSMNRNDQAMLLIYSPGIENNQRELDFKTTGAFRKDGTDTLRVATRLYDMEYHMYLGFVDPDRIQQSHSMYLGSILIPATPQSQKGKEPVADKTDKVKTKKKKKTKITAQDKTLEIARNLKNIGLANADIAAATGLSLEEIEQLV